MDLFTSLDLGSIIGYDPRDPIIFTRGFFWAFFAVVLAVFAMVYRSHGPRSLWLFAVSLFFYWKTSGLFVGLLLFSIVLDHRLALWSGATVDRRRKQLLLALSVTVNLSILLYFKYATFVVENLNALLGTTFEPVNLLARWANAAWDAHFVENKILLPVGISFYTFQCMSYAIDVYRGDLRPVRRLVDFGFYVSFFPQLVAGPIVRASEFIPQIERPYALTRVQFGLAVFWILNGMLKKMVIGDHIAVNFIDRVFADPLRYTGFETMMALFGYSLQVYADFSGYTDVAIGVALLMGFTLTKNFNSPYKATNVGEFWKRWHMSLSTWLRDYLYIPMGGNRSGSLFSWIMLGIIGAAVILLTGWWWLPVVYLSVVAMVTVLAKVAPGTHGFITTNTNLMITMLIGGLWHGASWLFVIWGGLNGLGLVVYKLWKRISPWEHTHHWLAHAWKVLITFTFITFTRIWFRSDSLTTAEHILHQLGGPFGWDVIGDVIVGFRTVFTLMCLGMIIHWLPERWKERYRNWFAGLPLWAMGLFCVLAVVLIHQTVTADMVPFIYFQF
ncbi:MAG: MBOAT family protein [Flavobacteriales bacterium]|nr:MBOAT family protein [Flavobacteriales bacterium]